jgi:DNA invertase Pin-like site-specific DNA recombinase
MKSAEKIGPEHRERRVFVYARQSSPAQVLKNVTSTERQLDLTAVAVRLGWSPSQIELVSEDLGRSGKFFENRDGFQRLAAEVGLGHAGAVLSLDVSRLARCSSDWYRLMEIAALTRTLLVDEDMVYDPRDPNDRLLLGMKGTMAEFELVWLRQRMDGGRWHLAKKGEYRMAQPAGYVWEGRRLVQDPDEEVRRAVALVFERYRVSGSCLDVVEYFAQHELRIPGRRGGRRTWSRLVRTRVREMLRNPIYAGAYVYGRQRGETVLEEGQRRHRTRWLPMSEWPVVHKGTHPGYLSWEEFMANRTRLADNARPESGRGAARDGAALLQGLLLCGRCGRRLTVGYHGQDGRYPYYRCDRLRQAALGEVCINITHRNVDPPVVELVLGTLTREQLGAATQVRELVEQEDEALKRQWALRLERARYEARLAERQYDACDPENRVVARTLETRWNEKLVELEKLEHEYEQLRRRERAELTDLDRQRILELADDLPKLWRAPTTTDRDRKLLLRLLVQEISIRALDVPKSVLRLSVLWHTQAVTEIEVEPPGRGDRRRKLRWSLVATTVPGATQTGA